MSKKKWKCEWKHDNVKGIKHCIHACSHGFISCYLGTPGHFLDVRLDDTNYFPVRQHSANFIS